MSTEDNEEENIRKVVLQNAQTIFSARKRSEEILQEQSEWLRIILSSIGDGVISTDALGYVTFLNGVAESLTGWKLSEALGRSLTEIFNIVNERTRQQVENPALRALREGMIVGLANHTILISKDGVERPIDDSAAPMRNRSEEIIGSVLVFRDVTERKKTEVLQSRLAAIVETSEDAIISKSLDGIIRSWNASAERLFGHSAQEAIGQSINLIVPPELEEEEKSILARLRRGERIESSETVRMVKNGQRIDISLTISPLRDGEGEVIGASKIARDITLKKQAERALRESEERHRFLVNFSAKTQTIDDPNEVMKVAAQMLADHLRVDRCTYAEIESEKDVVITGNFVRDVPSLVGRWPLAMFGNDYKKSMLANLPFVIDDLVNDPRMDPEYIPTFQSAEIQSAICVPLLKNGRFTAVLSVHQKTTRRWSPHEISLVQSLASRCWEILERVRVTRNLLESEARYRAIVEATPESVKLVRADGTILQVNSTGLKLIGADSAESIIGKCIYNYIAPEYRDTFKAFNERVCQGHEGDLEFDIISISGSRRHLETHAVPLSTPHGEFNHLGVTRDVTDRVAAERAMAETRARVDYAVRLSGVGFWYCDLPFDELIWDERVKDHFWIDPNAKVTLDVFYDHIHPDDRERTRQAIDNSIQNRTPYDIDYRTIDPYTGAIKWVRALGGTTYSTDGNPRRFDGVTVDITDRKIGELKLSQLLERERENARVLQQVADAALNIHASGTLDRVLHVITEETRKILGARQAVSTLLAREDGTQPVHTIAIADKNEQTSKPLPIFDELFDEVCRKNRPIRLRTWDLERHPAWKNHSNQAHPIPLPQGLLVVPLISRSGKNMGIIQIADKLGSEFTENDEAILMQLAHIASVAIENARLYSELRDQDRRKDEFLALLAHELRNPLAPLRNGLQVMRLAAGDPNAVSKARAMMDRQLGHMVRLIDDLLDVSRISRNKMELRLGQILLSDVISSAVETAKPAIDAAEHKLTISLPTAPVYLNADLTRLAQVFSNLLTNSAKYTPPGGFIWLNAIQRTSDVIISVRDSGIGIPAESLLTIFDMFSQVDRSVERSTGGLGIGLALVKGLVEMHGGLVEASSEGVGKGSTFTIRLPIYGKVFDPHAPSSPVENLHSKQLQRRILIVDDNRDSAESMGMMLKLLGNDIQLAFDGVEALEKAEIFQPDVILMDVGMPRLNGYDTTRCLRETPWGHNIFIIALTGWGQEGDREKSRDAGCDGHLVKPVHLPDLEVLLAKL